MWRWAKRRLTSVRKSWGQKARGLSSDPRHIISLYVILFLFLGTVTTLDVVLPLEESLNQPWHHRSFRAIEGLSYAVVVAAGVTLVIWEVEQMVLASQHIQRLERELNEAKTRASKAEEFEKSLALLFRLVLELNPDALDRLPEEARQAYQDLNARLNGDSTAQSEPPPASA